MADWLSGSPTAPLEQMKRTESYIKYAHILHDELVAQSLYVEAGKALLLHANLLSWTNKMVGKEGPAKLRAFERARTDPSFVGNLRRARLP